MILILSAAHLCTFFIHVYWWWSFKDLFLGKTLNTVSHLGAKQSNHCGGPAWQKTCK